MSHLSSLPAPCPRCAAQIAPGLLTCPGCGALVHAGRLRDLATRAEGAQAERHLRTALTHWRAALELLPPETSQYRSIAETISTLTRRIDAGEDLPDLHPPPDHAAGNTAAAGGLVLVGALALKSKGVLGLLLTNAKWLLAGLGKSSTLFTMFLSFGVYWSMWGWKFAIGLLLSIYIHEMGHVRMLVRYGIRATAPMFIPGLGALIRVRQVLVDPREDARVGLAGPWWGLGAALGCLVIWAVTGHELFRVLCSVGATINLFNLLPIGQLDGGRGVRALARKHRLVLAAVGFGLWWVTAEGLLVLFCILMGMRLLEPPPAEGHPGLLLEFLVLLASLTGLSCLGKIPG